MWGDRVKRVQPDRLTTGWRSQAVAGGRAAGADSLLREADSRLPEHISVSYSPGPQVAFPAAPHPSCSGPDVQGKGRGQEVGAGREGPGKEEGPRGGAGEEARRRSPGGQVPKDAPNPSPVSGALPHRAFWGMGGTL